MTDEEKIKKFEQLQEWLWDASVYGNMFQSTVASAIIMQFEIPRPIENRDESEIHAS